MKFYTDVLYQGEEILFCEELTLPKERSGLYPQFSEVIFMSVGVSLFAYMLESHWNNMTKFGGFGSHSICRPLERLETEINHVINWSDLSNGTPIKTLNVSVWVSFPGWQYSTSTVTY